MKIEKVLYRGRATSTGGRSGTSSSSDGALKVMLTTPKELGGDGAPGTNPEQLFAAGYSACFIGAIKAVGRQMKVTIPDTTTITAIVGIGAIPGGFGIETELQILIPGMTKAQAEEIVQKAHHVCPYSNATRGNIDVKLTVLNSDSDAFAGPVSS